MAKFRKKPVVIEAVQFTEEISRSGNLFRFESGQEVNDFVICCDGTSYGKSIQIKTLEGTLTASPGDWIIRGVNGEFYPCKPDIFEKTHEAV